MLPDYLSIEEISLCGRLAPPTSFLGQITMEWSQCNNQFLSAYTQDLAWMLLRLHPASVFQESTSVPLQHFRLEWVSFSFFLPDTSQHSDWLLPDDTRIRKRIQHNLHADEGFPRGGKEITAR